MTGNPVGLVEFLQSRLGELEFEARETAEHGAAEFNAAVQSAYQAAWRADGNRWHREQASRHVDRWRPGFVLADLAAKRRIIEEIEQTLLRLEWTGMYSVREEGRLLLKLLALPFKDHPDWQEQWNV